MKPVTTIYDATENRFYRTFNLEYVLGGRTFAVRILAEDWGNAEQHLNALIQTGRVAGEVIMEEV